MLHLQFQFYNIFQIPAGIFYRRCKTTQWVALETPHESNFGIEDKEDEDVPDPDFIASVIDGDSDKACSQISLKKSKASAKSNVCGSLDMETHSISFGDDELEWKREETDSTSFGDNELEC